VTLALTQQAIKAGMGLFDLARQFTTLVVGERESKGVIGPSSSPSMEWDTYNGYYFGLVAPLLLSFPLKLSSTNTL
jgi:hypothetical protein